MRKNDASTVLQAANGTSVVKLLARDYAPTVWQHGLELPQQLSFDRWREIGLQLSAVINSSAWCLGDWLVYGEAAYEGRYRKAIEETTLDYQTLRNYAWVVRRFPMSRRQDGLSFAHHAEVAAMPEAEQDYWLRKAKELSWSRNLLRRQVRASLRERKKASRPSGQPENGGLHAAEPSDETVVHVELKAVERHVAILEVKFLREQLDIWSEAASVRGISLENWVRWILEDAARGALRRENTAKSLTWWF